MSKLWLTYAWVDNEDSDVDHVIVELRKVGFDVHFDRRQIVVGQRLWPQIDKFISDPKQTDAWAIFATKHSLASEACQEELAYALDRALRVRGSDFPLIGIFPAPIDRSLI
jgi:TIR domain